MQQSFHIPAFKNLIRHLKSFADRKVLKGIWGVMELSKGDVKPTYRTNEDVVKWENFTITTTEILLEQARLELNQLVRMSNPVELEDLCKVITIAREDVSIALSRQTIKDCVDNYNKKPDKKELWTYVEDDKDADDYVEGWGGEFIYSKTDEDYILNLKYLDKYMESIIDLFVLPEFYSITDRVLRLFRVSQKQFDIFGPNNFDAKIRSVDRFNKVVEELVHRKLMTHEGGELYWEGIDGSNLASAAAVARYLEKSNILGYFGSMAKTREAYCSKFNITKKDQKEWNKMYRPPNKDGLEFYETDGKVHDSSNYWDQLGFIFDIE